MRNLLLSLSLALLASPAVAVSSGVAEDSPALTLLHLTDGGTLWGEIVAHDPSALSFRRLDNGGVVKLPWSVLDVAQSETLRETYGYVDHTQEELMLEADRLVLDDGTEVIGKIVARTDAALLVKTATAVVPVPKARLRGSAGTLQVPALEIYTREELYQQERANLVQDSASSNYELGRYCERILDFAHAAEHYEQARDLDKKFKPDELPGLVARAKLRAENQAQLDYLYQVDLLRARKRFDEAQKLADAFAGLYPDSSLLADVEKKKKQIAKAREQALRDDVVSLYHFHFGRVVESKVRDPQFGLEAALEYATDKLAEDLENAVLADLQRRVSKGVQIEEVRKHWAERKNPPAQKASYGMGTWLLGEDDARKGLAAEVPKAAQTEKDAERAKLEEKIKRYLANQAMVKKAKVDADKEGEPAQFWSTWNVAGKKQWLMAYFVEHTKVFQATRALFTNCPDCGGTGVREILNTGSARTNASPQGRGGQSAGGANSASISLIDCPSCHRIGVRRRVSYR
ncbi:MAG: hypothetical protein IT453_14015 [Planctomycetes bacterium]|nr:hypothetical protein [Planctomycetota bacterium]